MGKKGEKIKKYKFVHSATPCLLIGAFKMFACKVITDRYTIAAFYFTFLAMFLCYFLLLKKYPLTFLVIYLVVINSFSFFLTWEVLYLSFNFK